MPNKSKGFLNTLAKVYEEDSIEAKNEELIPIRSNYLKLLQCIILNKPLVKENKFKKIKKHVINLFNLSKDTKIKDFFIIKFILNFLNKEPQN
ncbi:hypothetical protein MWH25_05500 [Natroniella acetigena]|uniref:hypothetical protein n=1 Tax=Natroniella acetigena TaxID=52004 RepID=UPI00200A7ABF|nr:hypothetical protein [Natroniella acetigena]MCK8827194.1 hypothetical protein [Natroniella acetigena]